MINKKELLDYLLEEMKKGNIEDKTLVTKIELGDQEAIDAIIKRMRDDEKAAKPRKPKKRKHGDLPEHHFSEKELTAMAGD
jgi:hypothetical protein